MFPVGVPAGGLFLLCPVNRERTVGAPVSKPIDSNLNTNIPQRPMMAYGCVTLTTSPGVSRRPELQIHPTRRVYMHGGELSRDVRSVARLSILT